MFFVLAKQKKIESILNKNQEEKYKTFLRKIHNIPNDLNNRFGWQSAKNTR
jgi:hypothetical protein